MATLVVKPEQEGKTLRQLADEKGGYIPRLDLIASQAGIQGDAPLKAGQKLNLADPQSGEYGWASQIFETPEGFASSQQKSFQQEERDRLAEFTGRLQGVPASLEAVRQEMGIPQAFETFGQAGQLARGVSQTARGLPKAE